MRSDQAEGLRRLLGKSGLRVIALASARRGAGKTATAVNLAAALAQNGREVLLIDENNDAGNAAEVLGLRVRQEFAHVMRGECGFEQALQRTAAGFAVLPAARGIAELGRLRKEERTRLADTLSSWRQTFDVVVIDSAVGRDSRLAALPGQEDVLVMPAVAAAVTETYALIKQASAEHGKRRYRLLLTRVRDDAQARAIFANMAQAAQRYLGVELECMGQIVSDDQFKRAAHMGMSLLDAFPATPAAGVFRELADRVMEWPRPAGAAGDIGGFMRALARFGGQRGDGGTSAASAMMSYAAPANTVYPAAAVRQWSY